jgi:ribosomal protein S18 acetylase RimI-like enzyme
MIRLAETKDQQALIELIAAFRQSLAQLRNQTREVDLEAAEAELAAYQRKDFPIYVAETDAGKVIGYLVCRVDEKVVWAEALFVLPAYRRQGIGSALYAQAEILAEELGNETLYNWVDPTNMRIIGFLQQRGYQVLNLIELRRPRTGEELTGKIQVGVNEFVHS